MHTDGLKKNGEPDKRMSSEHGTSLSSRVGPCAVADAPLPLAGFGGDRERAAAEGAKGGKATGTTDDE